MKHVWHAVRSAAIMVAVLGLWTSVATADERHSGTIVGVDDRWGILVIDEMGPWVPDGIAQVARHTIAVRPATKIVSNIRVNVPGRFGGDFIEVPLELSDVALGDLVTVECHREGGGWVASSIAVAEMASTAMVP